MIHDDGVSIHNRLAGVESIEETSWKGLNNAARSMRVLTSKGKCPQCHALIITARQFTSAALSSVA